MIKLDIVEESKKFYPFHCGTQAGDWVSSNCERCAKGAAEQEPSELCEIAKALGEAWWGDGTVSKDIAQRMGYLDAEGQPNRRLNWQCGEVEWTQEWIDHCIAKERVN